MQASNPVLSEKMLGKFDKAAQGSTAMTKGGAITKTGLLLALVSLVGGASWNYVSQNPDNALWVLMGGSFVGFLVALPIIFGKINPILIGLYAVMQGVALGAISQLFNTQYAGSVLQAILLTIAITIGMLFLYAAGIVKVTEKLKSVIIIATVGVLFFYLLSFIIGLFSPTFIETMNSGTLGIALAAVVVIIASLNLLLDFDFIEKGEEKQLPKKYEWYAAFGLMVTLIWLYISILRLIGNSRR